MVPPEFIESTRWNPCLLAEVSPYTGPSPTGVLVVDYTNLAQRNIAIDYSVDDGSAHEAMCIIGHEDDDLPVKRICIHRSNLPKKAKLWVRFLDPKVEKAVLSALTNVPFQKSDYYKGHVDRKSGHNKAEMVTVDYVDGKRTFSLHFGSRLVLDLPMAGGRLTPVVLGVSLPEGTPKGYYELPLIEQNLDGKILGSFAFEVVLR